MDLLLVAVSKALNITIVFIHHGVSYLRDCTVITPSDGPAYAHRPLPYVIIHLRSEHHSATRFARNVKTMC